MIVMVGGPALRTWSRNWLVVRMVRIPRQSRKSLNEFSMNLWSVLPWSCTWKRLLIGGCRCWLHGKLCNFLNSWSTQWNIALPRIPQLQSCELHGEKSVRVWNGAAAKETMDHRISTCEMSKSALSLKFICIPVFQPYPTSSTTDVYLSCRSSLPSLATAPFRSPVVLVVMRSSEIQPLPQWVDQVRIRGVSASTLFVRPQDF